MADNASIDIGEVPWSDGDLVEALDEFGALYAERPIQANVGGMQFNHCFATWFMLRRLRPSVVIESGVYRGQSTWLIERACPEAAIVCVDVHFGALAHRSSRAAYIQKDFSEIDWSSHDLSNAVAIFDDHQNAYRHLKEMAWVGVRYAIFDDNYSVGAGDCYSPRQILAATGHERLAESQYFGGPRAWLRRKVHQRVLRALGPNQAVIAQPNVADRANLKKRLRVYYEFPPAFLSKKPAVDGRQYRGKQPLVTSAPPGFDGGYCNICLIGI